jgi:queuine tRNA-ribosyltransferase
VFGIAQGGSHAALREECARALTSLKFDGYAIGGVSVGEPEAEMMTAVESTTPFLPADQPRYAMGLGTPAQLVELVARGVDMFDCVLPTRVARNGTAFTTRGTISLKGGGYKRDWGPIEEGCECFACQRFTRAYLRHLLNVNEILGLRMLSVHNSHLFLKVMQDIRMHLKLGTFAEFRRRFIANYVPSRKVLAARKGARLTDEDTR